jgi:hypothetical protein
LGDRISTQILEPFHHLQCFSDNNGKRPNHVFSEAGAGSKTEKIDLGADRAVGRPEACVVVWFYNKREVLPKTVSHDAQEIDNNIKPTEKY